jgi:hypothetical protein
VSAGRKAALPVLPERPASEAIGLNPAAVDSKPARPRFQIVAPAVCAVGAGSNPSFMRIETLSAEIWLIFL